MYMISPDQCVCVCEYVPRVCMPHVSACVCVCAQAGRFHNGGQAVVLFTS